MRAFELAVQFATSLSYDERKLYTFGCFLKIEYLESLISNNTVGQQNIYQFCLYIYI